MYGWNDLECSDLRELTELYLGGELLTETNHAVMRHLQRCASCRREVKVRSDLRSTLRAAFMGAHELDEPEGFADRLGSLLLVAVTFGASAAFAMPIGYQTSLMIFGPGGYRARDSVKMGPYWISCSLQSPCF